VINFNDYKKREQLLGFLEQRMKGAIKIAKKAKAQGSIAELTFWHFSAKVRLYKELIEQIKTRQNLMLQKRFEEIKSKIGLKIEQKAFQQLMGEAEVLGEAFIFLN
jgi:t-SNARE complex subunit (syntaxin)